MLFTGDAGLQYGYQDGWTADGLFFYTGEGQRGDMTFRRGNLAIRDHAENGKDIHLFRQAGKRYVQYIGQMVCSGFHERQGPDMDGRDRRVIVFELVPIDAFTREPLSGDEDSADSTWRAPVDGLRERAVASYQVGRSPSERKILTQYRSNSVREYVLRRANGYCEACKKPAPFRTDSGRPYLEPHHIRRLSDGGPDHPRWVIALCPNCHRRVHYGEDRDEFNQSLSDIIKEVE
jgi:5-methylcytosine-specific restriction protein A